MWWSILIFWSLAASPTHISSQLEWRLSWIWALVIQSRWKCPSLCHVVPYASIPPPVQRQEINGALSLWNQKARPHRHVGGGWNSLQVQVKTWITRYIHVCQCMLYINIYIYMFASCSCGSFGQKVKYLCISNTQISNYLTVQQCTYLSISIDLSFYSSIHRVQTGVQPVPTDWCPNGWDDWTRTDGFLGRYGSIYWVPK